MQTKNRSGNRVIRATCHGDRQYIRITISFYNIINIVIIIIIIYNATIIMIWYIIIWRIGRPSNEIPVHDIRIYHSDGFGTAMAEAPQSSLRVHAYRTCTAVRCVWSCVSVPVKCELVFMLYSCANEYCYVCVCVCVCVLEYNMLYMYMWVCASVRVCAHTRITTHEQTTKDVITQVPILCV